MNDGLDIARPVRPYIDVGEVRGASISARLGGAGLAPRERRDGFAVLAQTRYEVTPDEPAGAGDQDAHAVFLLSPPRPANSTIRMKRLFDIAASSVGLVLLGWLVGVLAIAIRRNSEGPGLLAQERVGREGRIFRCYKLRTMVVGTAALGTHEHRGVAHITSIGHVLRRTKLDELPQLWNVLKGEMSLVGPRPCLPVQTALIEARRRRGVLVVRPGITGKAQVMGVDMSEPERLAEIDAAYIRERSFLGDLLLILRTVTGR